MDEFTQTVSSMDKSTQTDRPTMDKSTQTELSDLSTHVQRMDTLQWAAAHAVARDQGRAKRAQTQRGIELRRARYPVFLEELDEARRGSTLTLTAETEAKVEARGAGEGEETRRDEEGEEANVVAEGTRRFGTQASVLASSNSCVRSSRMTGRDLSSSVEPKVKGTHGYVILDKKALVSKSDVSVEEEEKEEEVQSREQSWAGMALIHDDECWVKPDRGTDLPCPCLMWKESSTYYS